MKTKGNRAHSFLRPVCHFTSALQQLHPFWEPSPQMYSNLRDLDVVILSAVAKVDIGISTFSPRLPLSQVLPYVFDHFVCSWRLSWSIVLFHYSHFCFIVTVVCTLLFLYLQDVVISFCCNLLLLYDDHCIFLSLLLSIWAVPELLLSPPYHQGTRTIRMRKLINMGNGLAFTPRHKESL